MNEVSSQTAALLLDALEHRGVDVDALWSGLPVTRAALREPRTRIDWETWVAMMERTEARFGVDQTEHLFVPGAGARTGHPFVRIANTFLSVHDVYALFARWGLRRALMVMAASFEPRGAATARFTITIDAGRAGSLPTLRFVTGILRSLPTLQDLPPAAVQFDGGATAHQASYQLVLPTERSRLARARRALRLAGGAVAALDELEQQATEIAATNVALAQQLAETERAAAALREREAWLGMALDAGRVGTWRWDVAGKRAWVSATAGQMLDLAGDAEHDTAVWAARVHPDDRATVIRAMHATVADNVPYESEYRLLRPEGEVTWLHAKGRLVRDGGVDRVIGTIVDVTAQKLLDSRLRFADRLIAAGTLAAGVAHEINNPLTYVLGNVDLLRLRLRDAPGLDPAVATSLAQAREGLERIRDVVADLRAFARPEERAVARVEPRAVCDAAIRIVSSLVRHRAAVTTDYAADTPAVLANESRLGQVLMNLIVNASHAMPERATTLNQIVVRTRLRGNGEVAIEVSDNGTGIAPDVLPRLFDPFFTTKAPGEGTGLGLSVCQSIVASLHGRIDVDTALGRGTTFAVVLPAAPPVAIAAPPAPAVRADGTGRHVLVIDDEPVVRRVVANMLGTRGYDVVQADSGRAGLALALSERRFHAVLCDLMMPDVDGVAVYDELTRSRPDLAARTVFITGGAVSTRTRTFVERPDVTVLPKPFSLEDLLAALDRLSA